MVLSLAAPLLGEPLALTPEPPTLSASKVAPVQLLMESEPADGAEAPKLRMAA